MVDRVINNFGFPISVLLTRLAIYDPFRITPMADFYPILAKAVSDEPNAALDARRKIYERVRGALFVILCKSGSPIPDANIESLERDLDTAIVRLENELDFQRFEPPNGQADLLRQEEEQSFAVSEPNHEPAPSTKQRKRPDLWKRVRTWRSRSHSCKRAPT